MNDGKVINFKNAGSFGDEQANFIQAMAYRIEQLTKIVEEFGRSMNELSINDRILFRSLVEAKVVTEEQIDAYAEEELTIIKKLTELLQLKVTPDELLRLANEKGIPLDRLPLKDVILYNEDLLYADKLELANKYSIKSIVKVLEDNKDYFLKFSKLAL